MFISDQVQLTTSITDFFVVGKMSVDLVGFVNLVGVAYQDPRVDYTRLHYIAGFLDNFLAKEASGFAGN